MAAWCNRFFGFSAAVSGGLLLFSVVPAMAFDPAFPGQSRLVAQQAHPAESRRLPMAAFADGSLPTQLVEGAVDLRAYQVALEDAATLPLIRALRDQLVAAGYEILFECETEACGGFDFRYGMEIMPEPDMHVNLGDFRYLLARRAGAHVALVVSRADKSGFVQITQVGDLLPAPSRPVAPPGTGPALTSNFTQSVSAADLIGGIEAGRAEVLEDLVFPPGSAELKEGTYPSLSELADWLAADSSRKVVLVGHTDASGGLAENIKLSKLRAESVRQRLLKSNFVRPEQILSEGIGYLSPRRSNLTEEGRQKNRRVEVMMTSTALLSP